MIDQNEILKQQISEQIALEEQFYKLLEQQILEIDPEHFADAKSLLSIPSSSLTFDLTLSAISRATASGIGEPKSSAFLERIATRVSKSGA